MIIDYADFADACSIKKPTIISVIWLLS